MKSLVVCYSRTGYTKKIGRAIAETLNCDFEEIIDLTDRNGSLGWLNAGRDAIFKLKTKIKPAGKQPSDYDLVVIGTPVWAWTMTPAVRTYIKQNQGRFNQIAFFCTMGGAGGERAIRNMAALADKKPKAALILLTREAASDNCQGKIKGFTTKLW